MSSVVLQVVHPSTQETEANKISEFKFCQVRLASLAQPRLHNETLSQEREGTGEQASECIEALEHPLISVFERQVDGSL